jgi:hypothetical protein
MTRDRIGTPAAPTFLSEAQLAKRWCCSRSTIQRLVRAGKLPHFERPAVPGGLARRLYPIRAIETIELEQTVDPVVIGLPRRKGAR